MKRILLISFLAFVISICSCNKDSHPENTFLAEKTKQELFSKLAKDPVFIEFRNTTVDLTMALFKTTKDGGKIDTAKLNNSTETDLVKKLSNSGVTNPEQIKKLSNKQVSLMKQLLSKYPPISKIPMSDWSRFIESQNKALIKERMSANNNQTISTATHSSTHQPPASSTHR